LVDKKKSDAQASPIVPFSNSREKTAYALDLRRKMGIKPTIHPSVTIPSHVEIGERVTIHEGCILGSEGFFLAKDDKGFMRRIPHQGKLIIEDDVEIFPHVVIDRGLVDDSIIGQGSQIGHKALISHDARIGKHTIIMMGAIVSGYVKIFNYAGVGAGATILQFITIGEGAFVGAGALVRENVAPDTVVVGCPATVLQGKKPPHRNW
jgi:UDP-3-O-[3-hydroxymyristoyl] glucosamine N-acyltransferase